VIYIDDLILTSKDINMLRNVKTKLKKAFKMTDLGTISNILGIKVQREDEIEEICLSQKKYVNKLCEKFDMRNAKTVPMPIESNVKISKEMCPKTEDEKREMEKRPYRELVRGLIYLANATRPDITFAASMLSCFCANLVYEHWLIAKRVRYLRALCINIGSSEGLRTYSASDWVGSIVSYDRVTSCFCPVAQRVVNQLSKHRSLCQLWKQSMRYSAKYRVRLFM